MAATQSDKTAELVDALFNFMPHVAAHVNEGLAELDMTTTEYWALRSIEHPMPMKELAHCMNYDPSYVTSVADRLETLGLVERQAHPTDRRIKNLALTAKGKKYKTSIPKMLWSDANTFSILTVAERENLLDMLMRLVADIENHEVTK